MLDDEPPTMPAAEPLRPFVLRAAGGEDLPVRRPGVSSRPPEGRTDTPPHREAGSGIIGVIIDGGIAVEASPCPSPGVDPSVLGGES